MSMETEINPVTKKKLTLPTLIRIIKSTIKGIGEDRVTRLSASLAYATLFSIIPFFSVIIMIGTLFRSDLDSRLFIQLQNILGVETIEQLQPILQSAYTSDFTNITAVVSLAVTLFGATAIFAEIQGSLNIIWGIKAVPKRGWLKYIKDRLLSFSVILILAFIMLVTLTITNLITNLSDRYLSDYTNVAANIVKIVGAILNFGVTAFIFALMFKLLPDAKIKYKDVIIGALTTTILFLVGQWGISIYFSLADVGSVYGVAAFLALLLTWIYYSAIIIYIGAEFTQAWANEMGGKIFPDEFAVATKVIEINKPDESIN